MLAVFATSLLLIACPSPGEGGGTSTSDGGGNAIPDGGKPTPPAPEPEEPTLPPKPKAWHVTTFAGSGTGGFSGTDGTGAAASFNSPFGIAQSGDTLYITDGASHSIRTIHTSTARVATIVRGNIASSGAHADGPSASARFKFPRGAAAFGSTLYVADLGNHRIRTIDLASAAKTVDTIAGGNTPGDADGAGTTARFNGLVGLALSEDGNTLYVAENTSHRIRAIDLASTAKTVSTIAGGTQGSADGAGSTAQFDGPSYLAVSGTTLYVADYDNHRIRAIDLASTNKTVSTIAGSGTPGHADGVGAAAQFNGPSGLAVSEDEKTLYVADYNNHRIRAIDITSGTVRDIAGDGTLGSTNGIGTAARLTRPIGIAVSGSTLYVTSDDLIRKLEYR